LWFKTPCFNLVFIPAVKTIVKTSPKNSSSTFFAFSFWHKTQEKHILLDFLVFMVKNRIILAHHLNPPKICLKPLFPF